MAKLAEGGPGWLVRTREVTANRAHGREMRVPTVKGTRPFSQGPDYPAGEWEKAGGLRAANRPPESWP